ncbi:MAG: ribonuclease R [Alphaproteobacteria bacterium]|nr:ribonuclease R [Alphaproteobacteria bacterium]MDD9919673.1 ribonuclease R [Alphaproteobacteria bacterium]
MKRTSKPPKNAKDFSKKTSKPPRNNTKKPQKSRRHPPIDQKSEPHVPVPTFQELPHIFEVEITTISEDGEPFALALDRDKVGLYPRILVDPTANVTVGDKLTIEIVSEEDNIALARVVQPPKKEKQDFTFLAVTSGTPPHALQAFNRELASVDFVLSDKKDFPDGTVLRVRPGKRPKYGPTPCTFVKEIANTAKGMDSLIAIDNHSIPMEFPQEVIQENENLPAFTAKDISQREDLRQIPIVTIDGADARDFDDAVWAEPWEDGHHIIVAIADVAHYIKPNSELDKEAFSRGNSTYFSDRVVPMLPERLCNDLCSLRPEEDRPVLAVHMYINARGQLKKHQFVRGVIHSHARLTYEQAQEALNGKPSTTKPLMESTLLPLQAAANTLMEARKRRHALELDIPEPKLVLDETNTVTGIAVRERLFTHQMIEELMVLANVAAATALETKSQPCMYRIHPEPSKEKLDTLRNVLKQHSLRFSGGATPTHQDYDTLLRRVKGHPAAPTLMRNILQSQQQAKYDPENLGHYGLALQRYAHFTSPIRRYSDLIVHRHLIKALNLAGDGGHLTPFKQLRKDADHINITERRSQQAEWEARDRLIARFYQQHIGNTFEGLVLNVMKFGAFVRVEEVAEGLLPCRLMDDDHYIYNEKTLSLRGKRTSKTVKVGQSIAVRLLEADLITGKLTFGPTK